MNNDSIKLGIDVDTEKLQDAADIMREMNEPDIIIRDNQNVYVTINNFNMKAEDYLKGE